jgi:hypothetical protein
VGSKDGYVYLFDLLLNLTGPLTTLRLPPVGVSSDPTGRGGGSGGRGGKKTTSSGGTPRVTGLSFNSKQRDLLSVCDSTGRVLVWKLGWSFSNKKFGELNYFESLGDISQSSGEGEEAGHERIEEGGGER